MAQRNACATATKTISGDRHRALILKYAKVKRSQSQTHACTCTKHSTHGRRFASEQGETVVWARAPPVDFVFKWFRCCTAIFKWLSIDEIENGSPLSGESRHSTGSEFRCAGKRGREKRSARLSAHETAGSSVQPPDM